MAETPSTPPDMTWEDIQQIIQAEMADAVAYRDETVAPTRAAADRYYKGDPEIVASDEGRSSAVSMDERDTIMAILPSLVRVFLGTERPVEFIADRPEHEDAARDRTDYVRGVIREVPDHFKQLYFAIKDALLRPPGGIIKWWWDTQTLVEYETYTGQLKSDVARLAAAPEVTDAAYEQDGTVTPSPDDGFQPDDLDPVTGQVPTYTVRLKRTQSKGRLRFAHIPGEEIVYNRDATNLMETRLLTHRREVTVSDLVAMGYTLEELEEYEANGVTFKYDEEFLARREANENGGTEQPYANPSQRTVLYCEHLLPLDRDQDGIGELTKVCTLGEQYTVVRVEDAPEVNFVLFEMDPEPGELGGLTIHSILDDLQRIKTAVLRAVLDSLRASTDPRIAALEGSVDFDDLLNGELGGVVRTTGDPNAVLRVLDVPFLGAPAIGVLDYLDKIGERRTGQTQGSQGLNAEHLQSTTAMAIGAQLSAAQQRIELIARILAETGFKPLFAGIQRTLMRHQQVERMLKVQGRWIAGDPSVWEAPLEVQVNVGLGAGTPADKIEFLQGILNKQEAIMKELGPNPIVDYKRYANTLIKAAEVGGGARGEQFFGRPPEGWAPPPPPEKPDPALLLAQIEQRKVETQLEIERLKLQQQREATQYKTETDRMKIEADMQVKILEPELKFGAQIEEARVQQAIEGIRTSTEAQIRVREAEIEQETRVAEAQTAAQAAPTQETA